MKLGTILVSEVPLFSKTIAILDEAATPQRDKLRIYVWVSQSVSPRPTPRAETRAPFHLQATPHRRFSHTARKMLQH